MTPERSESPVELSNSEEGPTAPATSTSNQIRVKNVSEINSNEAEATPNTTNKRKLPSWMLAGSSGSCKKTRTVATEDAHLAEGNESTRNDSQGPNGELDVNNEAAANGNTMHSDAEMPESSHCSANASTSNEFSCNSAEDALTSSTSTSGEPSCSTAQNVSKDEPSGSSTNEPGCSSPQKLLKQDPTDNDDDKDSDGTVGQIVPTSPRNIKPAIKVEKEEATSSTSRDSCKFGIRCYRRNPMHRIEEAHPGDKDYRRPDFPAPPDGTPQCPFGNLCYRRNPTHFQQYSHPPSTDFEQNWKNYKLRLRQRKKPPVNNANTTYSDLDDDDYDLDDPFIDDDDLDEDFIPSDLDEFDD